MAGRFLMQKLSSQMARSRRLFATHASATAFARIGGSIRTTTNLSNGAAHIGIAVPNNAGIHACEDGIRALSFQKGSIRTRTGVSHGTVVRPGMAFHKSIGIHACTFADSVGGAKRALSSDVCTRNRNFKKPQWAVEWDARSAAWQAECAAWEAEMDARTADFNKFMRRQMWLWGFTCFCWISGSFLEEYGTRCSKGKSSSHGTSSCGSPKS